MNLVKAIGSSLVLLSVLGSASQASPNPTQSKSQWNPTKIKRELAQRFEQVKSYAHTLVMDGVAVKRMYFRFSEKSPQYSMRSEWKRGGEPYVFIFHSDGTQYQYYPKKKIAYKTTRKVGANTAQNFRRFHFDYPDFKVTGTDTLDGKTCYWMKDNSGFKVCLWKENGIVLEQQTSEGSIRYDQVELDIPDAYFELPKGTTLINQNEK